MKCIMFYRQHGGHIDRVSDADAILFVGAGLAMYAPKHWWRAARAIASLTPISAY